MYRHWTALCVASSFRFGEAAHPGPEVFTIGCFNPTGLSSKHGVLSDLDHGIYAVSETHLTSRGVDEFRLGLKLARSPFSFLHGHPTPCRPRSTVAGAYSGVGFVSSFPGRVVSSTWPPEIFQSSRVQVASFLVSDFWVLGGVCYGFATETHRSYPLFDAVLDRVLSGVTRLGRLPVRLLLLPPVYPWSVVLSCWRFLQLVFCVSDPPCSRVCPPPGP